MKRDSIYFNFISKHWPKFVAIILIVILFGAYFKIFATGSPYGPGETLDPACAPGDPNCFVSIFPSGGILNQNLVSNGVGGVSWESDFSDLLNKSVTGITLANGATHTPTSATSMHDFIKKLLFVYVAPSGNIIASNTATTTVREVGDSTNISLGWSLSKSPADSDGNSFYIYGASSVTPSNATYSSGPQPSTISGGAASGSGTLVYIANSAAYNTLNGTATFSFTAYPCSALQAAAGSCTQSSGAGSVASGVNPPNVVAATSTVVYRSKVFYGSSTQSDGTLVDLNTLTSVALASSTARTSIPASRTFNLSGGNYIYFAWPQAFDAGTICKHDGLGAADCFSTPLGYVSNFVRTQQTRNGILYWVYRSYDINPSATYTIQ
ncbi:MAG: hypothetical protein NTU81_01495 [Candidatus Nomurabacteria bacterium]|nr:hypothetical protein [Candidatus Nomurabacteria bacterium]